MQQDDDACRHQRGRQGTLSAWNVSTLASTAQLLVQAMLFFQMPLLAFLPQL